STPLWDDLVAAEADHWDGLDVEYLSLGGVLTRFRDHPGTVDLVVAGSHLAGAIVDAAAHLSGSLHTVAGAWLSETGPGLFAAHVVDADEVAGFGVADPAGTLLAASLLRGEGLRARANTPRQSDRRRLDALDAPRLNPPPDEVEPDRDRRLPGDRRDRHHDADRQALLARAGRARAAAGDEERVPRRADRPAGPGA